MDVKIRTAEPDDIPPIIDLLTSFAEFEDLSASVEATPERLETAMFGMAAFVDGLVAVAEGRIVGYALFYPCFSSFRGQRGLYLEDLYVVEEFRGREVGTLLLKRVAKIAFDRGFQRIDFGVLEWNKKAISFYEKMGAVRDPQERHFKFTDGAFLALCASV